MGFALIGALLAGTGLVVVKPTGKLNYAVQLTNSAGLRSGDDVRIAGIAVGKVTSVGIDHTRVEAKFTVDNTIPIGSDSTVEIKLLTPLGGHYIALDPRGSTPLGSSAIPIERTKLPFEINELFQKFTPIVTQVDGEVVRETWNEVTDAARKNPDALKAVFDAMRALTRALSAVSPEWHRNMNFVNEHVRTFADSRDTLRELIKQISIISNILVPNSTDIIEIFQLLAELGRIAHRVVAAYDRDYRPIIDNLDDIAATVFAYPERIGRAAELLGQINNIVGPMLTGNGITVNESDRVIPGQDICLPHLFKQC